MHGGVQIFIALHISRPAADPYANEVGAVSLHPLTVQRVGADPGAQLHGHCHRPTICREKEGEEVGVRGVRPATGRSRRLVDHTSSCIEGDEHSSTTGGRGEVKRLISTAGTTRTRVGAVNIVIV